MYCAVHTRSITAIYQQPYRLSTNSVIRGQEIRLFQPIPIWCTYGEEASPKGNARVTSLLLGSRLHILLIVFLRMAVHIAHPCYNIYIIAYEQKIMHTHSIFMWQTIEERMEEK